MLDNFASRCRFASIFMSLAAIASDSSYAQSGGGVIDALYTAPDNVETRWFSPRTGRARRGWPAKRRVAVRALLTLCS